MPDSLTGVRVAFVFAGPLRNAVHTLKYHRVRRMARPLGALIAAELTGWPVMADAVIPIPMHRDRLSERGFNQSEALAAEVARLARLPLINDHLIRVRATAQQAGLDMRGRRENVRGAFEWQRGTPPRRAVLIDDVLTTGSTMGACAEALRAAGTEEVYGLALARSRPDLDTIP